jgi:pimeloyl-ACP methyl ester carboxylesterase
VTTASPTPRRTPTPALPRLILFPGLGADPRMFAPQRAAFPHLETPAWIPHIPGESLRAYAARFAQTLDIRDPAILGGVSLGGMLALEVARIVPTRTVILIASTRAPAAVTANRLLRWSHALSRLTPDLLLDKGRALAPLFLGKGPTLDSRRTLSPEHRDLLVTMAKELPISFIRWAAAAALTWPGCEDPPAPGVPVHHIHGDADWVFPLRRVKPDHIVQGGIHVLNLSHPDEVNAFLRAKIAMCASSS